MSLKLTARLPTAATQRFSMGLPKSPVFGWSSLRGPNQSDLPSLDRRPDCLYTSSGRAAIHVALQRVGLLAGDTVLLPSYHCPTMVAPVLLLGGRPVFYGIDAQGMPQLDAIPIEACTRPRAMLVAHYFGLPRSLAAVRQWCDRAQVALIEDCAHALFGVAGERPVGRWGDHATASLTKFLPIPECGVVVSNSSHGPARQLAPRSTKDQIKSWFDTLQTGTQHGRLWGLNKAGRCIVAWRQMLRRSEPSQGLENGKDGNTSEDSLMAGADMGRIGLQPVALAQLMARRLPRAMIVQRRQANYQHYARLFAGRTGLRPLFDEPCKDAAPYVFPLWLADADRIYGALHLMNAPVFRWDLVWPNVNTEPADHGAMWSKHVLQLLCHQDLTPSDIDNIAAVICELAEKSSRHAPLSLQ